MELEHYEITSFKGPLRVDRRDALCDGDRFSGVSEKAV